MPYIKQAERKQILWTVENLIAKIDEVSKGDTSAVARMLTYAFFKSVKKFYATDKSKWYDRGDVSKICRSVEREFERRFMDNYEQKKMEENGDV